VSVVSAAGEPSASREVAALEVRGLAKSFGATRALTDVELTVRPGEIHALVGENGAGKSTLLKVLAGALRPERGVMRLCGAPYAPRSPDDARRAGVAMVHQELSLCPELSVAENVCLGALPTRFGLLDRRAMDERARAALAPLLAEGAALDPRTRLAELPPATRQLVEIARALAREGAAGHGHAGLRLLILDEPTSSLGQADVTRLFSALRALSARGLAILYVSHFLEELEALASRFTVLRDGAVVGTGELSSTPRAALVHLMVGREVRELFPRSARARGDVVLELRGLAGRQRPSDASLTLRRGEVLGIAGLVGAGRTELVRAIFGLDPVRRGALRVLAARGPASPRARWRQGVGLVSEDRKGEGLALSLSLADNLTLTKLGPLTTRARRHEASRRWLEALGVRAPGGPGQSVGELSGGNQQKIAMARLLHHEADVLLLDEPTRGVDVASKAAIYQLIDDAARAGKAVLLVSSYLPELFGVCDRVAVMSRGKLGVAREVSETSEHEVLTEATVGAG
jgi:ribose transport system ATP-binding protein